MDTILGLDCQRIVVELTEHIAIENYRAIRELMGTLRGLGIRLAVDDVGAGYSSLRHIALLEPDIIKIDRSFTHAVTSTRGDRSVVAALVGFGQAMGASIVAEGIEDAQDLEVAKQLGVQAGQGWHIGMPAPLAALRHLPHPRSSLDPVLARSAESVSVPAHDGTRQPDRSSRGTGPRIP
jgi:EAL domain-containing protein (putative c-di-GMP-specific phosphodiesterase class I)